MRLCGSLPPFDKASAGKELPPNWGIQDRWIYYFPYLLSPRIRDKTSDSYQSFNIKIFELFDFAHLSGAVEDCEWFAFWIRHLPWLENVETLYLKSCEMPSNAMAAITCSFPRLRRVGLTNVDFTANNHSLLHDLSSSARLATEEEVLEVFAKMCADHGKDFNELVKKRLPRNGVVYTAMHPPPPLESMYINNQFSQYAMLDLVLLDSWILPRVVAKSLRSLELSRAVEIFSIAELINYLGPSPILENLTLWVGYGIGLCGYFLYLIALVVLTIP